MFEGGILSERNRPGSRGKPLYLEMPLSDLR
jgi:hypothetical protein